MKKLGNVRRLKVGAIYNMAKIVEWKKVEKITIPQSSREILSKFGRRSSYLVYGRIYKVYGSDRWYTVDRM